MYCKLQATLIKLHRAMCQFACPYDTAGHIHDIHRSNTFHGTYEHEIRLKCHIANIRSSVVMLYSDLLYKQADAIY